MRDSQRSRHYEAEWLAFSVFDERHRRLLTPEECQRFIDHVVKLRAKRMQGQLRATPMRVRAICRGGGRGGAYASHGWREGRIVMLTPRARTKYIILHEVAHHLAGLEQGHGPRFANVFHELVRTFIGQTEAAVLRQAYKEKRVRYRRSNHHANRP